MADTNPNTTRQRQRWQRGQQAEFRIPFLKRDLTPMQPLDAAKYPGFAIYSPAGIQIQTGVAQAFGSPGHYRVLWTVPADSMLSNDNSTWCIVFTFLNDKKKTYEVSFDFDVTEKQVTSQENRDLILLGVESQPFRVTWRGDSVPTSISLGAFNSMAPDNPAMSPIVGNVTPTGPIFDGDSVVYYYDVAANILTPGMYTFLWQVQENISAPSEVEFTQLRVIPRKLLQSIPQVKFIVNRFQAAFHLPNYISDADYVEGLMQGVAKINQWHPLSSYTYNDMIDSMNTPSPLSSFWLMAAAWWVLHSQHMVEANLAFNMCLEENTLVATSRGLVKIKYLEPDNLQRDIRKNIARYAFSEDAMSYMNKIHEDRELNGYGYTADDILAAFRIEGVSNKTLSTTLTRAGMEDFRTKTNPRTWALHDVFYDTLAHQLGVDTNKTKKFSTEYILDTPIGLQLPNCVYDLGVKKTIVVGTNLGYAIEGTKDHLVPVLRKDLTVVDTKLEDVEPSNCVLIKKNGYKEETSWDVDLSYVIDYVESLPSRKNEYSECKSEHELPRKMSISLARVLGYMVSEGWLCEKNYNFGFCNTDIALINDFQKHWKKVFGFELPEKEATNYTTTTGKLVRYFGMADARIFKFLVGIGFSECQAPDKEVPWCILQAPKKFAKHFLQTFFEGDGCYSKTDKGDHISRTAIFSSSSNKLRSHIQQLLLRFGIVASNKYATERAVVKSVTICGADLDKYAELVGFWRKGSNHESNGLYYTQKNGLPWFVLDVIKSCSIASSTHGWLTSKSGKKTRCSLGRVCNDPKHPDWSAWYTPKSKTISLERFKAYFEFNKEALKKHCPVQYAKLSTFYNICDSYVFTFVTHWEDGHEGHVFDPALPGSDNSWSHYFYANGFVTHNSGATATLDYDRTSAIESSMARLQDQFSTNLTNVKVAFMRMRQGMGVVGVRPAQLKSYQNRVFLVEKTSGLGTTSQMMSMMTNIGIAP